MANLRDNQLSLTDWFSQKQNVKNIELAILVDQFGNQESNRPLDDVWFDQSTRRVWHMTAGAATPNFVRCVKVPRPQVGLVVLIGKVDGSVETEVLQDASYLRFTGVGNQDWLVTDPEDLGPGGRLTQWIYSKQVAPLNAYPGVGLTISIVEGYYPYAGSRKFFEGVTNYPLTGNPNADEHYLAGLYIDSANTLEVVYGASVATGVTPPEPSWPAGAFELAAVLIDDVQIGVDFDTDVFDRRMAWSDERSSGGAPSATVASEVAYSITPAAGASTDYSRGDHTHGSPPNIGLTIDAAIGKTTPVDADEVGLADSAAAFVLKKLTWANLKATAETYFDTLYATVTHNLLSTTHADTLTGSVVAGDIIYGNATPKWARRAKGTDGQVLTLVSGLPSWAAAGGGAWPFARVLTVSQTDPDAAYSTIAAALAAATSGDVILLDAGTYTEQLTISTTVAIVGFDQAKTIITNSASPTITTTAANVLLRNVTVANTGNGATNYAVEVNSLTPIFEYCQFLKTSGVGTLSACIHIASAQTVTFRECTLQANSGTSNYGIYTTVAATITMRSGQVSGGTNDIFGSHASSTLNFTNWPALFSGGLSWSGTFRGAYTKNTYAISTFADTRFEMGNGAVTPPLLITPRATAPTSPTNGDLYIDDGTNTGSGTPGWRARIAGAWRTLSLADMVTAKGDLIAATASKAVARLAAGADGTELTGLAAATAGLVHAYPITANYTIAVSVATNDITVALKTLAGADAAAADPIKVRIGDTLQVITAALTTTKNDGTNWFNSGGNELKTLDVDYFVYLIQETGASAGTKIGFARIPYANVMGDFVNTTTSEKYIAGNWTNFNATDKVAVIGRFNAILSGTAAFNWSLTTQVIINRPIYETRFLTYTPTVTSTGGTITTVGAVAGVYQVAYNKLFFNHSGTITTNGTGAGAVAISLPLTPVADNSVCAGRENAATGNMLQGRVSSATIQYFTYANAYPGGSGNQIVGGGIALRLI